METRTLLANHLPSRITSFSGSLANQYEIEQGVVGEAGQTEEPVAGGLGPPDPDHDDEEDGVGQADQELEPDGPVVEFGHVVRVNQRR